MSEIRFKKQNNPDADGFRIVEFDIYQMVLDLLEEKGYTEKCIKFEQTKGRDYLYTAISKMLRLTSDNNLIVNRIVQETPKDAVVFDWEWEKFFHLSDLIIF